MEVFYSDLYKADSLFPCGSLMTSFLNNPKILKLSVAIAEVCEGKFTNSERFKSLQTFQKNKSPGNDGLTAEFYKAFWHVLGDLVVEI